MMSYTSAWTCLWSSAGMLMRRTSPSTRIIGGSPADRCRSEALFLTENANSSAISMRAPLHCKLSGRNRNDCCDVPAECWNAYAPRGSIAPTPRQKTSPFQPFSGALARTANVLTHALHDILHRLENAANRAGRPIPRLLAVSKTQPADAVAALAALGQHAFGENYVQEAAAKQAALVQRGLEWHLIGHLQSNKAREAASRFDWVQTVDRERLVTA